MNEEKEYKKLVFKNKSLSTVTTKTLAPTVEVFFSGINYKDALGVTGRGPIFKTDPIIPGIDFSGVALNGRYAGEKVLAQGSGFGESFDGGYTQYSYCCDEHLILLPQGLSLKEAAVLGTAGFTAALSIHRMLHNGLKKDMGPVLISGATGGVGSFSIQIFKKLGFSVSALTHRIEHKEYLLNLGADEVIEAKDFFSGSIKPLSKAHWGGVVDNLGGEFLEKVLTSVSPWGCVSSIGLAKSADFKTTVMPFILRGVSLLGASSTHCPKELRESLWQKLSEEWKPSKITELVSETVTLEEVLDSSHKILDHKSGTGRVLVDLKK